MGFWDELMGQPAPVPGNVPSPDQDRHLALYKYEGCGYCSRVKRVLEQLDIQAEMRDTMRDPGVRAELYNKTRRSTVPCLFIDGEPLFESEDIVAWLRAYAKRQPA